MIRLPRTRGPGAAPLLAALLALACVAGVLASPAADAAPSRSHECAFVEIPGVNHGGAMELVVSGIHRLPPCRRARRLVYAVPRRLPMRTWRMLGSWNCNWSRNGGVWCKRPGAGIVAYPGGD